MYGPLPQADCLSEQIDRCEQDHDVIGAWRERAGRSCRSAEHARTLVLTGLDV